MPARRRPPRPSARRRAPPAPGKKPVAGGGEPAPGEELALLGDRHPSQKGSPALIRRTVGEFVELKDRHDQSDGVWAYDAGTMMVRLYRWRADEQYGHRTFPEFVLRELGIKRPTMYRHLSVARYATREQARWGPGTVLAVGRLILRLRESAMLRRRHGLAKPPATINDLKTVRFTLPDGRVLDFGGKVTRADVDELLLSMQRGRPVRRLDAEYMAQNKSLARTIRGTPALRGVTARHRLRGGKRRFDLSAPEGVDLKQALRALLDVLDAE